MGCCPLPSSPLSSSLSPSPLQSTPLPAEQLQKDKDELLRQVVSLQQELEEAMEEGDRLKSKVGGQFVMM